MEVQIFFVVLFISAALSNAAPDSPASLDDFDLDEMSLDELGSLNDMQLFKANLALFGVNVESSGSNENLKTTVAPVINYPDTFIEYNSKTAPDIIDGKPLAAQLWIFLSKNKGDYDRFLPKLEELVKIFKGRLIFVTCNVDKRSLIGTLESVKVRGREAPTMRIIFIGSHEMDIYKPEDDSLTAENVEDFIQQYLDHQLKPIPAGQLLPDDWDKRPVKVLVAENIEGFIKKNPGKRVVVKYYSPTCPACVDFAKLYEKAAVELGSSEDLVLADIDITKNELPDRITILPTVKIYEDGVVVHENNGLAYDELIQVLKEKNLKARKRVEI